MTCKKLFSFPLFEYYEYLNLLDYIWNIARIKLLGAAVSATSDSIKSIIRVKE